MARLVSNSGSPAWVVHLKPGINSLGRGAENDIQVNHPSVSTHHCRILVDDRTIRLEDLGSTNGTFVNGEPALDSFVKPGQVVRFGSIEFRIEAVDENTADLRPDFTNAPPPPFEMASSADTTFLEPTSRLSRPSSAPTESAAVVASVVTHPQSAAGDKSVYCRNHYRNVARFECPKCRHLFCDLCVNTRGSAAGGAKFCKVCGIECRPITVKPISPPTDFFSSLPEALKYPFVGDGWFLLIGGGLFFGLLDLSNYVARHALPYGMRAVMIRAVVVSFILGTGYLFSYLKKIIACTIEGDKQMPDWPELMEWREDIVVPMFQFLVISILSFGPCLFLYLYWEGDNMWAVWLVALMGCLYFPMAWLGVAIFDSLTALHPLFVVGSIVRIPKEYSVAAGVFAAIIGLRWLSEDLLAWVLHIPLVPALLADLFAIVLLLIEARILGLLYRSQKPVLGWFNKR